MDMDFCNKVRETKKFKHLRNLISQAQNKEELDLLLKKIVKKIKEEADNNKRTMIFAIVKDLEKITFKNFLLSKFLKDNELIKIEKEYDSNILIRFFLESEKIKAYHLYYMLPHLETSLKIDPDVTKKDEKDIIHNFIVENTI